MVFARLQGAGAVVRATERVYALCVNDLKNKGKPDAAEVTFA